MELPLLCDCRPKGMPGKKQCILSIDGGGVRGIMATVILESLELELQKLDGADVRIADYFDLIAGTSTGALVASLLVSPDPVTKRPRYTAKETTNFYIDNAAKIFPSSSWWLISTVKSWYTFFKGPKYDPAPLQALLHSFLGDLKLSETVKTVLIPSYDIKNQNSLLFSTTQAKSKQIPDCYIRDVCRSSTAAPTYFPPYYFSTDDDGMKMEFNMVDGGMAANNPVYLAVCELLKDQPDVDHQLKYEDLLVLSVGTGEKTVSYDAKTASKWGALSWINDNGNIPVFDILMMASQDIADYSISNAFLGQSSQDNYFRIQTDKLSDTQSQLDNSSHSNLLSLEETAKTLLQSKAQIRNKLGQFVEDTRWPTYQAGIVQYAAWLVEERRARKSSPSITS